MRAQGGVREVDTDDRFGFAAAMADEAPPPLETEVARAIHCWGFCGGHRPDLLPLYHALHGLPDWELTTLLLDLIRDPRPEESE